MEDAYNAIVTSLHTVGKEDVALALCGAIQAKNAILQRNGITAAMAVFGRTLRWPEAANKDDDRVPFSALGAEGHAWRVTQARTAAKLAIIARDASDKLRRSVLRNCGKYHRNSCQGRRFTFLVPIQKDATVQIRIGGEDRQ